MTTGPETIAAAIRDGFRELAEAVRWHSAPKRPPIGLTINPPAVPQDPSGKTRKEPRSDEQAEVASVDPEGNHTPQTPVERAAWVMLKAFNEEEWEIETWQDAAQALADAGLLATTRPMTVGQLTAEHIGKLVRVGDTEFRPCEIEHYRKKPVVIEAMRWDGSLKSTDDVTHWCGGRYGYEVKPSDHTDKAEWIEIPTLEGIMRASVGDYVIRGVKGEFYPCKPDVFEATYEPLGGDDAEYAVTDSEPDVVPSAEGLTVGELDALPEWSVVYATGGERWFVKTPDDDYWLAIWEVGCKPAAELIQDEGPIRLECRAPGPEHLVIKRDELWLPGYLRREAAELDACGPAAGVVRTVADALEAEQ